MRRGAPVVGRVLPTTVPAARTAGPGPVPGADRARVARQVRRVPLVVPAVRRPRRAGCSAGSALALLVAEVLADHHDPPVTADHLALVADLLDARVDLHVVDPVLDCAPEVPRGGSSLVAVDDA